MVAVKAAAAESFTAKPDPGIFCFLIYGPDTGLVAERAAQLAKSGVDDPDDAFALVKIDGDEIASDPERLLDEAHTVALFGGRRAIWVRAGSRPFHAAVDRLLAGPAPDARIVIEAGDLKKSAPLRTLVEKNARGAAIPCYSDSMAAIGKLVERDLAEAGLGIDRDAREALLASLGADRLATRQEIGKLALYALGDERVTLSHVDAVVAESSVIALDDAVDAVFTGNLEALERGVTRLAAAGTPASAALAAALRHALQLHKARGALDRGAGGGIERVWPGLHFRRKDAVETALQRWSMPRLDAAIQRLANAVLEGRRAGAFGEVIARRTLAQVAGEARRR